MFYSTRGKPSELLGNPKDQVETLQKKSHEVGFILITDIKKITDIQKITDI
jgi:hypothetical protein